jgi:DNA-binding MarR family transcriptional regulator
LIEDETQTGERQELTEESSTFLRNMHRLNMSIVQQLSPILEDKQGIDLRLYYILHCIDGGAVYPGVIAQEMRLPNSLVTKHLDQLAELSLLERSIDTQDSRRIRVNLTPAGLEIMSGSDRILSELVRERLARISPARRAGFLSTLVELASHSEKK